ncbi:hypothetical protein M426DRAFT_22024 [Hypoxylon sp. CI-4A]|nr:hypothetical protein M426DRAFT_22024 [Hypoxylon sp. CI-4A]
MGPISQYHGSLIAFEGPQDTISTQLRLLPNSPNILIIPSLRHFMKEGPEIPFDARSHILAVHQACRDRAEIAQAFLRDSLPSNKRLVFMDGGTASAQKECILEISERLTNGDYVKAERFFNRLVRNGISGSQIRRKTTIDSKPARPETTDQVPSRPDGEAARDPASEAMRAAEVLDLETAFLQTNNEIDLSTTRHHRSTSVPVYRIADDFHDAAPFYVFGARKSRRRNRRDSELPQTPRRSHTTYDPPKGTRRAFGLAGPRSNEVQYQPKSPPNELDDEQSEKQRTLASFELASSRSFKFASTPNTPSVCEALAVEIRPSASTVSHTKTKSVDRIYSGAIRNQDVLLCSFPEPPRSRPQSLAINPGDLRGRPMLRSKFACEIPRPTFSTPPRSMVRRNPPPPLNLHKATRRPATYVDRATSPIRHYVDRGTTTEPEPKPDLEPTHAPNSNIGDYSSSPNLEGSVVHNPCEPNEPILPMVEDLVIFFKTDKGDKRLEETIQAFRDGTYPIPLSPSENEAEVNSPRSGTPTPREPRRIPLLNKTPNDQVQHAEVTPSYQTEPNTDEYDPFAYTKSPRPSQTSTRSRVCHRPSTPPTPAQTPPLATRRSEKCFHDFITTDCRTAVCMQNSLRSILNIYFPPEDEGYHQFNFPLLPELSSLWKPVFREADPGTVIRRKRKVDLILAIGAQQGVDKDFLAAISGSLEKLGTKPNGVTRSGRLDLRFLIASAMQAFTSQPLANQTQDNPFSNPLLLATLIIPHLETYMAAHAATRFLLLEYPPEHLTTVLALQRLVGVDLLRIAGILYSENTDPKPNPDIKIPVRRNTHLRLNSRSGLSTTSTRTGATLLTPSGLKQVEAPSFSKANFLLTSSANESEIATLISEMWKILIEISSFYIPEGVAPRASTQIDRELKRDFKRDSNGKPLAQTPLINTAQQYAPLANAAVIMGFRAQVEGDPSSSDDIYTDSNPPPPPPKHSARPLKSSKGSISETIRSSRTVRTMRSHRNKLRNMIVRETVEDAVARTDNASLYQEYWDEEDDDGLAADERRYMPLYGRRGGPTKGSSRKALKWLGLAT